MTIQPLVLDSVIPMMLLKLRDHFYRLLILLTKVLFLHFLILLLNLRAIILLMYLHLNKPPLISMLFTIKFKLHFQKSLQCLQISILLLTVEFFQVCLTILRPICVDHLERIFTF